jgi:hypothetical protein
MTKNVKPKPLKIKFEERKRAGGDAGKAQASSEMASRLQEYEQTIIQNEKILATLREQSETDRQQCEEFKESLQGEKRPDTNSKRNSTKSDSN